jgi:hypothetical protein
VLPEIGAVYHLHPEQATKDAAATVRGHRDAIVRYRGRPWWPRGALAAVEVRAAWDELRRGDGDARRLLARPGRLLLLPGLLGRRFALRRAGARVDDQGRPVVALLPGADHRADDSIYVVDLRGAPVWTWLASLIRRAPSTAVCATPAQRLICRLLGISRAGPP